MTIALCHSFKSRCKHTFVKVNPDGTTSPVSEIRAQQLVKDELVSERAEFDANKRQEIFSKVMADIQHMRKLDDPKERAACAEDIRAAKQLRKAAQIERMKMQEEERDAERIRRIQKRANDKAEREAKLKEAIEAREAQREEREERRRERALAKITCKSTNE